MQSGWRVRQIREYGYVSFVSVLVGTAVLAATVLAQDMDVPTLRVYANLIQIPTLVLGSSRQPMRSLTHHRFFIRIDGGPRFHVPNVRIEGDDPIALAALLDVKTIPPGELTKMADAMGGLAPNSLHRVDSVSVYALNCQLVRTVADEPTTPAVLEKSVTLALSTLNGGDNEHGKERCRERWNLLDAVSAITRNLAEQPARRVILVFTGGLDEGSKTTWGSVSQVAQARGVAIFASVPAGKGVAPVQNTLSGAIVGWRPTAAVKELNSLCETTGGIILETSSSSLDAQLRELVSLVRARYILEFPRPAAGAGMHNLDVSIENVSAFIRPAGSSFPLRDPALKNDPNTILPDPSAAPVVGPKGRDESKNSQ